MKKALWGGTGLVALAAFVAFAVAPTTVQAEDDPSVEINVDAVMKTGGLPYFWAWPSVTGTFEATGDVEDEGSVYGSLWLASMWFGPVVSYWDLALYGNGGTIFVRIHVQSGGWTVTGGTGDYASATGSGTSTCTVQWNPSLAAACYAWTLQGSIDV